MPLSTATLDGIQEATALIKWRKATHHVIYFESAPEAGGAQIVYIPNRAVAGSDLDIGIGIIEALLPLFGRTPLPQNDARPEYSDLGLTQNPVLASGSVAQELSDDALYACAMFAAVLRYRRGRYHIRYQADDGHGTPTGNYLEGTNFSSSMDVALLASAIETLLSHLGGTVQPGQPMPDDVGYGFFNELIEHLQGESSRILSAGTSVLPNDKTAILTPRATQPIHITLTSEVLDEIARVTAVMKWRKAHYHVVYSQNNPDNSIGDPVYITGREIAGEDFNIAIAMLEAILPFFDRQAYGEREEATTYADIPIKPAPIAPDSPVPPRISNDILSDVMQFAAIMRWRKSIYHLRYQGDDGFGNPTHEYPEHPGGFSSGVDTLLLASMLETLGMHLGGDIILPQPMPDGMKYSYFESTIERLRRIPPDEVFAEMPTINAKPGGSTVSQTDLLEAAASIRKLLPTRADHNEIELISMAIQIKPYLEKYLALIQPLLEEKG